MADYNPQGGYVSPQNPSRNVNLIQGSQPNIQPNVVQAAPAPTGGGGGGGVPIYDAEAAAAAQRRAQADALKGSITGIINNVRSVYDAIYGDLNVVGADKANSVQQRYNKENTALVDTFNTEFPAIGNAYSARNTYDSSYRRDSEAGAQKQFENMQGDLQTGRDEDLAKVGQFIATQRAQVGADKGTLDNIAALIAQSEDPEQLQTYAQQINDRLSQVQASRAGLQSQAAYRATADQLVSSADRSAGLKQTLSNIISGAAPAALKRSVAGKLIQSSGLPQDQQAALVNDFEKQLLNGTDPQVIPQG